MKTTIHLQDLVEVEQTYSVPEAAAILRESPSAIRAAITRGELPCAKINCRNWAIKATDAARWFRDYRGGKLSELGRARLSHRTYPADATLPVQF